MEDKPKTNVIQLVPRKKEQQEEEGFKDVQAALTEIVDQLKNGEFGEPKVGAFVLETDEGVALFVMGPDADLGNAVIAFQRGISILCPRER